MAQRTVRLGAWENDTIVASFTFNDANGSVSTAAVVNNSDRTAQFLVWRMENPGQGIYVTIQPHTQQSFNVPAGVRFSEIERPVGDPRETNFGYSVSIF